MDKVEAYRASDGSVFETEDEAIKHEAVIENEENNSKFFAWLDDNYPTSDRASRMRQAHAKKILGFYSEFLSTMDFLSKARLNEGN